MEALIGFRGPVAEPISAGPEPGERGTVSASSQYGAPERRPQRRDWRGRVTSQEAARRAGAGRPGAGGAEGTGPGLAGGGGGGLERRGPGGERAVGGEDVRWGAPGGAGPRAAAMEEKARPRLLRRSCAGPSSAGTRRCRCGAAGTAAGSAPPSSGGSGAGERTSRRPADRWAAGCAAPPPPPPAAAVPSAAPPPGPGCGAPTHLDTKWRRPRAAVLQPRRAGIAPSARPRG